MSKEKAQKRSVCIYFQAIRVKPACCLRAAHAPNASRESIPARDATARQATPTKSACGIVVHASHDVRARDEASTRTLAFDMMGPSSVSSSARWRSAVARREEDVVRGRERGESRHGGGRGIAERERQSVSALHSATVRWTSLYMSVCVTKRARDATQAAGSATGRMRRIYYEDTRAKWPAVRCACVA